MAEDDPGGFESELFPQLGGGIVAELVGVPTVGLLPSLQFGLLFDGEPYPPLNLRLVAEFGQRFGRREGLVAGTGDGAAVAARRVCDLRVMRE